MIVRRHGFAPRLARHDSATIATHARAAEIEAEPSPRRQEHPAVLVEVRRRRRGEPHRQRDEAFAGERAERRERTDAEHARRADGRRVLTSIDARRAANAVPAIASAIRSVIENKTIDITRRYSSGFQRRRFMMNGTCT